MRILGFFKIYFFTAVKMDIFQLFAYAICTSIKTAVMRGAPLPFSILF